uniref:Uncharacterized protein n=1 Tax=Rhizophagus irregularis (strain DAOM 181602 / DAOM 197198 / MUCL 43194) TaxID=747089 RepID=U9TLA7_RHIID
MGFSEMDFGKMYHNPPMVPLRTVFNQVYYSSSWLQADKVSMKYECDGSYWLEFIKLDACE